MKILTILLGAVVTLTPAIRINAQTEKPQAKAETKEAEPVEMSIGDRDAYLDMMSTRGWEFELNAGLNIGGATPLGMPRELRKIHSYSPRLNTSIEGKVTKWWGTSRHWGTSIGIKLEQKAMTVKADVKSYHMEIIRDGDRVQGYWTGYVNIHYSSTFLTFPVTADYRFNDRWMVRAGLFFSFRTDGEFSGFVRDGYLLSPDPTGERIVYSDGQTAAYDFNDDLRVFHWGPQIGASWRAYRHFSVNADITYSFNNIFKPDFHTVHNTLHPLYFNIGFGYAF